jgi:hypothetical protein
MNMVHYSKKGLSLRRNNMRPSFEGALVAHAQLDDKLRSIDNYAIVVSLA